MMGYRHHDPSDHCRTTQPHAGITMKDNFFWPGFLLLAVAFAGMMSTAVVAAHGHYEWLAATVFVPVLGTVAGPLWFVGGVRRVARVDEQVAHRGRRQPALSGECAR
jgi:nitrate reductase NapE component